MIRLPTRLDGPILLEHQRYSDGRGFFEETWRRDADGAAGIDVPFVQDNHSRSSGGTLRGLHFQRSPGQAKLVGVTRGGIQDVVVDLRPRSITFGAWESFLLDEATPRKLFVPVGFAHGFLVLSAEADVVYKVSSYYDPAQEAGLAWDDPELAIEWQTSEPRLSPRDAVNPSLGRLRSDLAVAP